MDKKQLNQYVANEGYVVRVPHNPLISVSVIGLQLKKVVILGEYEKKLYV